jgi:hypothetical protein
MTIKRISPGAGLPAGLPSGLAAIEFRAVAAAGSS